MSDLVQAALISGGIFALVMLTQYGRRSVALKDLLRSILMVGAVGFFYLGDMPFSTSGEWNLYGAGLVLGLAFGAVAMLATRMEVDAVSGKVMTICGAGFVTVWAVAVLARLGFIYSVENISWVHEHVGLFMMDHGIESSAIAPFFVIWALTMVIARIAVVQLRARTMRAEVVSVGSQA